MHFFYKEHSVEQTPKGEMQPCNKKWPIYHIYNELCPGLDYRERGGWIFFTFCEDLLTKKIVLHISNFLTPIDLSNRKRDMADSSFLHL